jgi:hypothetical protein
MTFSRTKITTSNDTDLPRVVHLGLNVIWYVYRRADRKLYLQREAAGARGAEVEIAQFVSAVDVAIDPGGLKAWIYFVTDGSLRRIEVTTTSETPSTQAVQRNDGWYERVLVRPSMGTDSAFTPTEIGAPTIALFDSGSPLTRTLVAIPPSVNIGRVSFLRIYRALSIAGAGFQLYATLPLLGAPYAVVDVPAATSPAAPVSWIADAVRDESGRYLVSRFSSVVVDKAQADGDIVRMRLSMGSESGWTSVDRPPIKFAAPTDSYPFAGPSMGSESGWTSVDRPPIKFAAPTDSYLFAGVPSMGSDSRWTSNGIDVLNP